MQVLEKQLTRHVDAEHLFLQRPTRPLGEHHLTGVQHRLIEKGDDGEQSEPNVVGAVARLTSLLLGGGKHLLDARPERVRVSGDLPPRAETGDRRKRLLE